MKTKLSRTYAGIIVLMICSQSSVAQDSILVKSIDSINYYSGSKIQTGLINELIFDPQFLNLEKASILNTEILLSVAKDTEKSSLSRLIFILALIENGKFKLEYLYLIEDIRNVEVKVFLNHCQGFVFKKIDVIIIEQLIENEDKTEFRDNLSDTSLSWRTKILENIKSYNQMKASRFGQRYREDGFD